MGALTGGSIASAASDREGCGGDASGGGGGDVRAGMGWWRRLKGNASRGD